MELPSSLVAEVAERYTELRNLYGRLSQPGIVSLIDGIRFDGVDIVQYLHRVQDAFFRPEIRVGEIIDFRIRARHLIELGRALLATCQSMTGEFVLPESPTSVEEMLSLPGEGMRGLSRELLSLETIGSHLQMACEEYQSKLSVARLTYSLYLESVQDLLNEVEERVEGENEQLGSLLAIGRTFENSGQKRAADRGRGSWRRS